MFYPTSYSNHMWVGATSGSDVVLPADIYAKQIFLSLEWPRGSGPCSQPVAHVDWIDQDMAVYV